MIDVEAMKKWTIDDKMAYFMPFLEEEGYSEQQIELFRKHTQKVWPDGLPCPKEDLFVVPLTYTYFYGTDPIPKTAPAVLPDWLKNSDEK